MNEVKGIKIRNLSVYHPDNVRDNDYYVDFYGEKGNIARKIAEETLGRDKRFVIDPDSDETTITMAVKACKKVLKKEGLKGKDIDIICFCTFTSEYVMPPGALIIHNEIGGKEKAICYDLNVNCIGMIYGLEQLSKYMSAATGKKRALLVGADYCSFIFNPKEIMNCVSVGDAACAVIIEKTDDLSKTIDTDYYIESHYCHHARAPMCGFSNMLKAKKEDLYYSFQPPETSIDKSAKKIKVMLQEHNLKVSDIKLFCTSQFSENMGKTLLSELGASENQGLYVGDKYGYTGQSSPFLCLHEAIRRGMIKRGDYIVMWTLGASAQYIMSLIHF